MAEDGCIGTLSIQNLEVLDTLFADKLIANNIDISGDVILDNVIITNDFNENSNSIFNKVDISGHLDISGAEINNNLNVFGISTFNKVDLSGNLDVSGFTANNPLKLIGNDSNLIIRQQSTSDTSNNAIHFLYPGASIGDASNAYIGYKHDNSGTIVINGNLRVKKQILTSTSSTIDISGGILWTGINNSATFHGDIGFVGQTHNNGNDIKFHGLIYDHSDNDKFILFKDLSGTSINSNNLNDKPHAPNNQIEFNDNSLEYAKLHLGKLSLSRKDNSGRLDISGIIDISGQLLITNGNLGIGTINPNGLLDINNYFIIQSNGNIDISGNLDTSGVSVNKNLVVNGNSYFKSLTEKVDISGHLDTSGITINKDLDVIETTTLQKVDISVHLDTSGITINKDLDVSGLTLFRGKVDIDGQLNANNLNISQDLIVNENTLFSNTSGKVDISGHLDASGVTITNILDVSDTTTLNKTVTISGNTILSNTSTLDISGDLHLPGGKLIISGGISGELLFSNNNSTIWKSLSVIDADVTISTGSLGVSGPDISGINGYTYYKFLDHNVTNYQFNIRHAGLVEVLVVGAGGSGGKFVENTSKNGGGGGGGGVIHRICNFSVGTYNVKVGEGGPPLNGHGGYSYIQKINSGTNHQIFSGGGGYGNHVGYGIKGGFNITDINESISWNSNSSTPGFQGKPFGSGSGGGDSSTTTSWSFGGGGAGGDGGVGGIGGSGKLVNINGYNEYFGGGGAGTNISTTVGENGNPNTGDGGGGRGNDLEYSVNSTKGGSGIVILKVRNVGFDNIYGVY